MEGLKPCPFCGGRLDYNPRVTIKLHSCDEFHVPAISCAHCCAMMFGIDEGAIAEKWNTRHVLADLYPVQNRPHVAQVNAFVREIVAAIHRVLPASISLQPGWMSALTDEQTNQVRSETLPIILRFGRSVSRAS